MEYTVRFGSSWKNDGFGFYGSGVINIDGKKLILAGRIPRKNINYRILLIEFIIYILLNLMIFWLDLPDLLEVIVHGIIGLILVVFWLIQRKFFPTKPSSYTFRKGDIRNIKRSSRMVTFKAPMKETGKMKRSVIMANSEEDAKEIEFYLKRT